MAPLCEPKVQCRSSDTCALYLSVTNVRGVVSCSSLCLIARCVLDLMALSIASWTAVRVCLLALWCCTARCWAACCLLWFGCSLARRPHGVDCTIWSPALRVRSRPAKRHWSSDCRWILSKVDEPVDG